MAAPKTIIQEQDMSTRVPSFPGLYCSIVLPAKKGPVGVPTLVSSDDNLLKRYTPDETIRVGDNLAFYSALATLQRTNKLWVIRPNNGCKYGGALVGINTSTNKALASISLGSITEVNKLGKTFTVTGDVSNLVHVKDMIKVQGSPENDNVYTIKTIEFVTDKTVIAVEEEIASEVVGGSIIVDSLDTPENFTFGDTDALLITGKDQGKYNSDLGYKLFTYETYPDRVKEPNAFILEVYKKSTGAILESFLCSRNPNKKDGYGRNIYVEDAVKASNYINVIDNVAIDEDAQLKDQETLLVLTGGFDGYAVTDTQMIASAEVFANKNQVYTTLILDGGWTTPAYQKALIDICERRMDCVAILSMPYSAQDSSDYVNEMINYRKVTLNANSSYGALYAGHVLIRDRFNDREIYVSPDGYVASIISFTASNFEIWYPPAGYRRGVINVLKVKRVLEEGELDILYDNGINPIKFTPGKGITVHGQKTLSSRPSALDRLNVRLLLITIEPAIAEMLEDFLFEFNDAFTRGLITSNIETFMESVKSRKGVYAFKVVCDESNNSDYDIDNNQMNVHLFVEPTKSSETIKLGTVITRTGQSASVAVTLLG